MRASKSLAVVERRSRMRLEWLRGRAVSAIAAGPGGWAELAFVTIDLVNTWGETARALFVSTVQGAVSTSGRRVSAAPPFAGRVALAIDAAKRARFPRTGPMPQGGWERRDEPKWHDKDVLVSAMRAVTASNAVAVDAAVSGTTSALDHAITIRNFYAHRNRDSLRKVWNVLHGYGLPMRGHPDNLLRQPFGPVQSPIIVDWIDDYILVAAMLFQ